MKEPSNPVFRELWARYGAWLNERYPAIRAIALKDRVKEESDLAAHRYRTQHAQLPAPLRNLGAQVAADQARARVLAEPNPLGPFPPVGWGAEWERRRDDYPILADPATDRDRRIAQLILNRFTFETEFRIRQHQAGHEFGAAACNQLRPVCQ